MNDDDDLSRTETDVERYVKPFFDLSCFPSTSSRVHYRAENCRSIAKSAQSKVAI
jgi:hypothetical protein